ncbi:MAG TPA: DNA polymerase III subunit delta' [Stellaceae bacterium]|nr:DNA polymerase III subunit delta' [Stellaceae bacterium]
MARTVEPEPEADGSAPSPRANPDLIGHESAERELERLWRAGRLPHAILLGGPQGIGKATLAFRFARFLLAQGDRDDAAGNDPLGDPSHSGLAVDPENGVFRRVAAGGHADLLTVERGWDPRRRRLRGDIVVEDTREISAFFRLTAAEEGWRVVIVDGAEQMNRNAANAVLKILEEPPARALLLLVSHSPGQLLPTIRSRCRRLMLAPLEPGLAARLTRRYRPQIDEDEAAALAAVCAGSVGRALDLVDNGGLELYRSVIELLLPEAMDVVKLHGFADRLARADAADAYRTGVELLSQFLARMTAGAARGTLVEDEIVAGEGAAMRRLAARADPARWAGLRAQIEQHFAAVDELNLDHKQAVLGAFFAIAGMSR